MLSGWSLRSGRPEAFIHPTVTETVSFVQPILSAGRIYRHPVPVNKYHFLRSAVRGFASVFLDRTTTEKRGQDKMSFSQINATRSICNFSLSLFLTGCLYGQGTVVEVHKLPSHPLANFQNTYLPGSVPVGASDFGYTLGGIGSGLFKGPGDGPGIFWMISDRGPNPQDASSPIRRAFPTPWYTPFILQVKTEDNNDPI